MPTKLPFQPFQSPEHEAFFFEGGQPAALLVHGFPGTPQEMRAIGQALHENGWTARGILLPGFGKEIETLPSHKAENWLKTVTSALNELRRDHSPLILVGNSMGSALSLAAASQTPVDGLILFAPLWKIPGVLWACLPVLRHLLPEVKPFHLMKPDYDNAQFRAGLAEFLPGIDIDDPKIRAQILEFIVPINLFDEIRKAGKMGYKAIPKVDAPVMILQGRDDNLVQPALTRRVLQRYPGMLAYAEFPGGHDLYDESKAAWPGVKDAALNFAKHILKNKILPGA